MAIGRQLSRDDAFQPQMAAVCDTIQNTPKIA
jgi:hypothetical protein